MNRSEQMRLAKLAQDGDVEARDKLVLSQTGLVWTYAKKYARNARGCDADDLFQRGMIEVLKSVSNFDTSRGFQFSTYAVTRARYRMLNDARCQGVIYVPPKDGEYDDRVKEQIRVAQVAGSIERFDENNRRRIRSTLMDKREPVFDAVVRRDLLRVMWDAIRRLPEDDSDIVTRRLRGEKCESLGRRYGVTKQRIDQRYQKIVHRLKRELVFCEE